MSDAITAMTGMAETTCKPALLLHSCCGPCSTAVIERLVDDYDITVYFYNPCITDREEYEKRKENQIRFIEHYNLHLGGTAKVSFIEGDYDPENYFQAVAGHEQEPEGGSRCTICFDQRLTKTAEAAKLGGYPLFTTTLTVSPHKNYPLISAIGKRAAEEYGVEFLDLDFKKKAGFQRSIQLSREYELYRQNYCGCEFSKR
ncbi:MAG: epoxyqueuosine reductase QueH [Firmicutes bacterium]|nr:epoxyqueuosine reductase QueH [Bacillota bacterium]